MIVNPDAASAEARCGAVSLGPLIGNRSRSLSSFSDWFRIENDYENEE